MKLGCGPYADWAYGEVLIGNPGYVEFPTEETRRGDMKTRFLHWAIRKAISTLPGFTDNVVIVGDPMTPEQSKEKELKKHEEDRRQTKANPILWNLLEGRDC